MYELVHCSSTATPSEDHTVLLGSIHGVSDNQSERKDEAWYILHQE